jgi:subtilase family serine protease
MRKEMRILLRTCIRRGLFVAGWYIPVSLLAVASFAQQPAERIKAEIDDVERASISGSHSPLATAENETGRMAASTALQGINIVFSRTPAQEADLQALLAAQQDPTSPSYHQWLTPEEFGARFGVADADIAKVRSWLEKRGFTVDGVSRSKNRITFSGTVEQVEATFGTEMHYYKVNGETHFAASQDVSVPAALSSLVLAVTNLTTFRPKPHIRFKGPQPVVSPNFTSSQTQNHFLTPKDVATIYDMNAAYNAGYNGAGQSIAVVGQSDIVMTDIENFQTAAGFTPVKDPVRKLASSTSPGIVSGDEAESDIDLEYTSTIANGATIYFVYSAAGAFDAITYAVQNKTAPIVSISYGVCEAALASSEYTTVNGILAQAASQGQSVIAASGDSGSTDCYVNSASGSPKSTNAVLAVDFPSSSQYVTGMGGTEFPAADVAPTNTTYWQAAVGSDVISSALKYIPEQVWNDDTASTSVSTTTVTISAGGGGVSTLTPRPTWQTGVPGIPSGTFRFVPDISLSSSPANAPYLFCSSDFKWTGVTGSCSNGFRDSSNTNLTVAGGTSFAAPIFAGMLANINQKLGSTGQGVVNSTLYMLAANATTYASAFHDIISGGNECNLGTTYCSTASASGYTATTGYDEASGLGSIDFFNLLSAWPGSSKLAASKTTLMAANATPAPGANDVITITVASASGSSTTTPTGTLTIVVDGTTATSSLALVNGSATYTFSSATAGAHAITATYSGDTTYAASNGSLTVTVTAVASQTTVSAATTTPAVGVSDLITITVASGSASSSATPTGSVTIAVDSTAQAPTLTLASGSATYTFSSTVAGSHTITATYPGDSIYAASTGMLTVTVAPKSFKLAANAVTVASGSSGATAVTITPQGGYTGTIAWTVSSSPALTNGCFSLPNTSVSGSSGVNATLTVFTVASSCPAPAVAGSSGSRHSALGSGPSNSGNGLRLLSVLRAVEISMAMAGLLLFELVGRRRSPRLGIVAAACMLVAIGLVASGCSSGGGSSSSPPPPSAAKGTYTVTIVGADTVSSSITATTTMTLTIN